ncbi:hypothetical protein EJ110_NYTH29327 [Nymphaea thermarum]|nr:hypothetical protein EJ110_NYTH29327 [Nymphaea thermarum]
MEMCGKKKKLKIMMQKNLQVSITMKTFRKIKKEIIRPVEPLVRVLKMVHGKRTTMGYLSEALDRAKEAIKSAKHNFSGEGTLTMIKRHIFVDKKRKLQTSINDEIEQQVFV